MNEVIVFRVDASTDIGTGHVMRCLRLAAGLKKFGAQCHFICREHEGNLLWLIQKQGYSTHRLSKQEYVDVHGKLSHASWLGASQEYDAKECLRIVEKLKADWVIVDHYALDSIWEETISRISSIAAVDDLADRSHICNVLIDQNWYGSTNKSRYKSLIDDNVIQLLGPQYALLGPEYRNERLHLKKRNGLIKEILIFMGGADPNNVTQLVLEALSFSELKEVKVKTVVGLSYPYYDGLTSKFSNMEKWEFFRGVPTLAPFMREADLMIGAGGSTNWERMCLGLPSIILSIAKNQIEVSQLLAQEGYITYLGNSDEISRDDIRNTLSTLSNQPDLLVDQSNRMMSMVDGLGIERVCEVILKGYAENGATSIEK